MLLIVDCKYELINLRSKGRNDLLQVGTLHTRTCTQPDVHVLADCIDAGRLHCMRICMHTLGLSPAYCASSRTSFYV